jgi:hypothetical protein
MPKPTRDYELLLRNEIVKVDAKIAKLQEDRERLIEAHTIVAGFRRFPGLEGAAKSPEAQ